MTTTISKWGNSQGVRIPSEMLKSLDYSIGDEVTIIEFEGKILIIKTPKKLNATGILNKYVKERINDETIDNAWKNEIERKWHEKNS